MKTELSFYYYYNAYGIWNAVAVTKLNILNCVDKSFFFFFSGRSRNSAGGGGGGGGGGKGGLA